MGVKGEALGVKWTSRRSSSMNGIKLEENNRKGNTRDLFRNIGEIKEHFAQR